ncbi:MAG: peptidoglycan DD-metalloendopeptidase family protein, partial [Lysobacterales bacterium]
GSGSGSGSAGAGKPVGKWRWPTEGKIVRGYSGTVHKGVDIDGKAGDAVRAVAAGKVVYAGSGIVGYGNLLIVKHNDLYLSAYGHNRSLLVQEGESVAVGQRIAEKGSSATNAVKLHFEIRREGKPVDPVTLLPSR